MSGRGILAVMKSPFPGIDPYLQRYWSDIHSSVVPAIKASLQPRLPAGLRALSEERIILKELTRPAIGYRGDVAVVTDRPSRSRARAKGTAAVAMAEEPTIVVEFYDEQEIDRYVEIIDTREGDRVVTAIELLSPRNKTAGDASRDYQRKVRDYIRAGVNLVEIDLIRGPRTRLRVRRDDLPVGRRTPYLICVRRATPLERWECFPVSLRNRVPRIPIPLRPGDPDVVLDLQPLLDRAYRDGAHDGIDYGRPPVPRLSPADAAWADALLRAAGRRA